MTSINVAQNCPKINLPRYFMDSSYRKAQTGVKKYSKALVHHIASELNITEINLNSFYDNYDRIMEYLLIGPGRTYLLSSIKRIQISYGRSIRNIVILRFVIISKSLIGTMRL